MRDTYNTARQFLFERDHCHAEDIPNRKRCPAHSPETVSGYVHFPGSLPEYNCRQDEACPSGPVAEDGSGPGKISGNNVPENCPAAECTDAVSKEVYTANIYDSSIAGNTVVYIGQKLSNNIATYNTPGEAMNALKTAGGGTTSYPFFLKHTIADGSLWYATNSVQGLAALLTPSYPSCIYETSSECNSKISNSYVCKENAFTQGVLESYVGFVVTPEMATANPGTVAGTYYLKGGDDGKALLDNAKIIYDAFGGVGCSGDDPSITTPSSNFGCDVSGLNAYANSDGSVGANDGLGSNCNVYKDGYSACSIST